MIPPTDEARRLPTLRTTLLGAALFIVLVAASVMIGSLSLGLSWRDAVERDSEAYSDERRVADLIIALTYEQQLIAYRYLQHPGPAYLDAFRARGDEIYSEIHSYLFHALSMDARLGVENIKESHQEFEVAATRAFEHVQLGRIDEARLRLRGLDDRAAALGSAVRQFLEARSRQRVDFRREYDALSQRLHVAQGLVAVALIGLAFLVSSLLRRRVILPLDQLSRAARRIGDGDLSSRIGPQPYVELDAVAIGFNHMADRIKSSREAAVAQNQELRDALDHLHTTQEELVQHEKLSAMGQMLAGLAHELNNPLGGILGMAELLRAELADSPHTENRAMGVELAAPLEREALRATALVRSLLDFARKPSGELESVNLAAAVSTAVGLRAHAFAQAGKTIHVEVPPELSVIADAQKLQHAVVNLVNNALDAIVAGGGVGLEVCAAADSDGFVRLEFDDDGTGIANLDAVFTPFYTTKAAGKGTGLGLMLVRRFVTEFAGTVAATNRERGARITIRLRAGERMPERIDSNSAVANTALLDRVRSTPASTPAIPAPISVPSAMAVPLLKVLVVDDEHAIREIQRRLLTRAGFDVVVAASGAAARDVMLREHVDLVVTDLRMPGAMDGSALLDWMSRERPALAQTALLATGDVSGAASVALPVPIDRIVNKPFEGAEFVQRVREALGIVPSGAAVQDARMASHPTRLGRHLGRTSRRDSPG